MLTPLPGCLQRPLRVGLLALFLAAGLCGQERIRLTELGLEHVEQGWGEPRVDASVEGRAMVIGGRSFAQGLGTHADFVLRLALDGRAQRLLAWVGVDDETGGRGSVRFRVVGDGAALFESGVMRGGQPALRVDVALEGVRSLLLLADDGSDDIHYDHADWAEAVVLFTGEAPRAVGRPQEPRVLLTPAPGPEPRLNGPRVCGVRPGRPFLYRIPATGVRPMQFAAEGLPAGLSLDPKSGILSGRAPAAPGAHRVRLQASNADGADQRELRIVVGDTLALTPPMGWNSWYVHYDRVTQADVLAAAQAMVESGMADCGYSYVNIDDCWMVRPGSDDAVLGGSARDEEGAVRSNGRFPDMAGLVDSIHALGLKAGIYISPGPRTCAGYAGSYGHEEQDARRFAAWGFDFLKYDWCSYGEIAAERSRAELMKPYVAMGAILRGLERDVVFNLCQYGMGEVWEWGAEVGGNCWRTTGDLGLGHRDPFRAVLKIGLFNATLHEFAGPGRWNDPDYLLLGWVGDAFIMGEARPTTMTPNEHYATMSLWSLMAAPLIFSGDMTRLDAFTLSVLCNAEVIEVDQDPLGRQARIVRHAEEALVLAKPMADGSLAVGLFNLAEYARPLALSWGELGLRGAQRVRDLWRQVDLGREDEGFSALLGRHEVALLRLWPLE